MAEWTHLAPNRATWLGPVDAFALVRELDPLPAGAPACLALRTRATPQVAVAIPALLDGLWRAVCDHAPAWPPGAEYALEAGTARRTLLRTLAEAVAAEHDLPAPFLAAAAVRAIEGMSRPQAPAEVQAFGLPRIFAMAQQRSRALVVLEAPALAISTSNTDQALVAAAEWLAFRGQIDVAVTGEARVAFERLATPAVPIQACPLGAPDDGDPVRYLPVRGRPHPGSPPEQRLARVLAVKPWAEGHAFNQELDLGDLAERCRVDVLFPDDKLVVEVDGPEHGREPRFSSDRRRDTRLELAGYRVLRVSNGDVLSDVEEVAHRIEQLLALVRAPRPL